MGNREIAAASRIAFRKQLLAWYARNKRAMPWRGTRDAYRVWVSEIMLQQTRVAAALPYYRRFVKKFPTVRALARARSEEVLKHWAGLGYYSRARNLHRAATEIVARQGGKFPRDFDAALALPGVGRYTAAAVLSIAYGEPRAVVDGNVARVVARLTAMRGDVRANGRWRQIEEAAQDLMSGEWRVALRPRSGQASGEKNKSADYADGAASDRKHGDGGLKAAPAKSKAGSKLRAERRKQASALHASASRQACTQLAPVRELHAGDWNQAMMELGATLCTPRAPRCGECPVARWCRARKLGVAESIPSPRKKRAPQRVEISAAVLLDGRGRTLLVKPETDGLFSRMWQFPAWRVKRVASGEWRVARKKTHEQALKCGSVEVNRKANAEAQRSAEFTEKTREGFLAALGMTRVSAAEAEEGFLAALGMTRASAAEEKECVALPVVKHTVTYREVTLQPYLVRVRRLPGANRARVVALSEVARMAVSSATKKIARTAERGVRGEGLGVRG